MSRRDVRVSRGGLDQSIAWFDLPFTLSLLNHTFCNAVFDGTTGIEELAFRQNLCLNSQGLGDAIKANERSTPNVVNYGIEDSTFRGWGRHFENDESDGLSERPAYNSVQKSGNVLEDLVRGRGKEQVTYSRGKREFYIYFL